MKKTLFALVALFCLGSFTVKADGTQEINALKISFNDSQTADFKQFFVNNPVLTYTENGTKLKVSWDLDQSQEFDISAVKEMTFYTDENPTKIEDIIEPTKKDAVKGIFDLNGRQLKSIEKSGIYIVNGEKVWVAQ